MEGGREGERGNGGKSDGRRVTEWMEGEGMKEKRWKESGLGGRDGEKGDGGRGDRRRVDGKRGDGKRGDGGEGLEREVDGVRGNGEGMIQGTVKKERSNLRKLKHPSLSNSSHRFLKDLLSRIDENILITDVCDIIHQYALYDFSVYIDYIRNQGYQERAYSSLM